LSLERLSDERAAPETGPFLIEKENSRNKYSLFADLENQHAITHLSFYNEPF
jgi:hypothetical protein